MKIYSTPTEIRRALHNHEILFVFTDDDDAELFDEWWRTEGEGRFFDFRKRWNHTLI